jgi:hypothetical protein
MILQDSLARRLIGAAALVGLVLRLAFGLLYWVDRPLTHDEHEYLSLARSLAAGNGFAYDDAVETGTAQRFGRAPGYPLFLAALDAGRSIPSSTPVIVKVVQSAVGAITVWLIGAIALHAAGVRAGVVAAAMAAVYPPLVWIPAYALSETLHSLAALLTVFVLQRGVEAASSPVGTRLVFLGGALTGLASLIRPVMIVFLPLAVLWLIVRRKPALAAALTVGAVLMILPWTVRNLRVYDRFVLIASEGGVTFWTGNHPLAIGEGDLAANPELKRADLEFRQRYSGLSAEELEPVYYREAFRWVADHPRDWLILLAHKVFYTVIPVGPSYAVHSATYRIASVVPYVLVLPLAVMGARRLWLSPRRPVALFLLAGSTVLMCLVFFPQERFRIPVIDPTLIIAAAALAGRSES